MMEAFGLTEKAHSSVEGVAAEPFVFNSVATYVLYKDTQLTQSTRYRICHKIRRNTKCYKVIRYNVDMTNNMI